MTALPAGTRVPRKNALRSFQSALTTPGLRFLHLLWVAMQKHFTETFLLTSAAGQISLRASVISSCELSVFNPNSDVDGLCTPSRTLLSTALMVRRKAES